MDAITFQNVSKSFGKVTVLDDMSFSIPQGNLVCLLGPSGSGKTTIMKLMLGSERPSQGRVSVLGHQLSHKDLYLFGVMPQSDAVYLDLSGYDNLLFFGKLHKLEDDILKERIHRLAELLDMSHALHHLVSTYSGGMKKRLSLMIALLHDPKVLILDEPTVGIDPILRKKIWKEFRSLQNRGKTLLISTHVMDEVTYCDHAILIREGKILAQDRIETLLKESEGNIETLFLKEGN